MQIAGTHRAGPACARPHGYRARLAKVYVPRRYRVAPGFSIPELRGHAEYIVVTLRSGSHATKASGIDLGALGIELPEIDNDVESYQRQLGASFDVSRGAATLQLMP